MRTSGLHIKRERRNSNNNDMDVHDVYPYSFTNIAAVVVVPADDDGGGGDGDDGVSHTAEQQL